MTNQLRALEVVRLTASFQELYAVPDNAVGFTVAMLHIVNTSSAQVANVSVCLVPDGGTPQQDNALLWNFEVPARGFMELLKGDIWPPGYSFHALGTPAGLVNLKLSGIETTP